MAREALQKFLGDSACLIIRIIVHEQDFPFDSAGWGRGQYAFQGHCQTLTTVIGTQNNGDFHRFGGSPVILTGINSWVSEDVVRIKAGEVQRRQTSLSKPDENSPFRRSKIPHPRGWKAASWASDSVPPKSRQKTALGSTASGAKEREPATRSFSRTGIALLSSRPELLRHRICFPILCRSPKNLVTLSGLLVRLAKQKIPGNKARIFPGDPVNAR